MRIVTHTLQVMHYSWVWKLNQLPVSYTVSLVTNMHCYLESPLTGNQGRIQEFALGERPPPLSSSFLSFPSSRLPSLALEVGPP